MMVPFGWVGVNWKRDKIFDLVYYVALIATAVGALAWIILALNELP
jgi:hypothetical protein